MAATGDDTVALVGEFWRSRGAPAVESIEWVGQTDTIKVKDSQEVLAILQGISSGIDRTDFV
ncbi:MAG: hypothetical protein EBE86_005610 [Hormoscilla sp. GUM202]|nr:hypothetical protein [Hormoscilla sp. GUM202]